MWVGYLNNSSRKTTRFQFEFLESQHCWLTVVHTYVRTYWDRELNLKAFWTLCNLRGLIRDRKWKLPYESEWPNPPELCDPLGQNWAPKGNICCEKKLQTFDSLVPSFEPMIKKWTVPFSWQEVGNLLARSFCFQSPDSEEVVMEFYLGSDELPSLLVAFRACIFIQWVSEEGSIFSTARKVLHLDEPFNMHWICCHLARLGRGEGRIIIIIIQWLTRTKRSRPVHVWATHRNISQGRRLPSKYWNAWPMKRLFVVGFQRAIIIITANIDQQTLVEVFCSVLFLGVSKLDWTVCVL